MKKPYLICAILLSINIYSQSVFNSENFTVTSADLETNFYEKDSTANALVLYEYGNSYVDDRDFRLKTEIKKKIKIFNKQGFNKATIQIYLYNKDRRREKVTNIMATTYNVENGLVTKTQLNENDIIEEVYNENNSIIKFTFPNLKEGSVINYSYMIDSPFMFKYKEWDFQEDIPKLYSEYNTSIPGNWEYNIRLVGYLNLTNMEESIEKTCLEVGNGGKANCINTIYRMKDIPAFIMEDFMTTKENYLSRLEYELKTFKDFRGLTNNYTKTWKTVHSEIKSDKNLGKQLGNNSYTKELLPRNITDELDVLKKATDIYKYVQTNYTWNEKYSIWNDVSVKDLINNKSGKVSEINMLLYNLLESQDFDVTPILISTRDNGLPTKLYPVISDFNYLIVQIKINDNTYLLDATDKYLAFGQLPFRCLNQYGHLLDFKTNGYWIDLNPTNITTTHYRVDLKLEDDDILLGKINANTTGYHALPIKKKYYDNKIDYLKKYKEKYHSITFLNHTVSSEDKTSYEFLEEFEIEYQAENIGGNLYINPFLFKLMDENPFKLQERTYPIDFGFKDTYLYTLKIDLNENYDVLETPEDLNIGLPNNKGLLIFTTKVVDNSILMYFKFNFKEAIYNPDYYESLKMFMGTIIDVQKNSLLVLKHK
ncbi:DUF3857 domain-containing protein [Xanthomarina spongicola]|uniref:Uncharacterized protein DUF3857 n=1 Tax=Xanthomarina spongicola TaxID=570520 RepID=A0A316DS64_9FLAO|nr:DUF3857 domain-containing protein [Xanthomarina spongicola]PWK19523.1 uncharacterized protein DUF3857 [Xanthomarina spongicola]